jgi:cytochrome P450
VIVTERPATVPRISAPEIEWDPRKRPWYDARRRRAAVFSYADVLRVLHTDGITMSQQYAPAQPRTKHPNLSFIWSWDGAAHDDRRALLEEPFKRALRGIVPLIQQRTNDRIEEILRAGTGGFDAMRTLALVPYDVITALIGAPLEDTDLFLSWLEEANASTLDDMPLQEDTMQAYFRRLIEDARGRSRPGLLDELVRAQAAGATVAGKPLDDWDILAMLWGMYSAGTDTTGNSFASTLLLLVDDPALFARVRERPELIKDLVEEALRLDPAFTTARADTVRDVDFSGVHVPAGTTVEAWIPSANRDPDVFPDPDVVRLDRRPNPHLTFGNGLHLCLGAPLARLELKEMLRVLFARLDELPGLRWDPDAPCERRAGIVHRYSELHFTFDRR